MRNLIILILGVTMILTSCGTFKDTTNDEPVNQIALLYEEQNREYFLNLEKLKNDTSDVNPTNFEMFLILPGQDDSFLKNLDTVNLYSTYDVYYKNGQVQTLSYGYQHRLMISDSVDVIKIDTVQYKVRWSELF